MMILNIFLFLLYYKVRMSRDTTRDNVKDSKMACETCFTRGGYSAILCEDPGCSLRGEYNQKCVEKKTRMDGGEDNDRDSYEEGEGDQKKQNEGCIIL